MGGSAAHSPQNREIITLEKEASPFHHWKGLAASIGEQENWDIVRACYPTATLIVLGRCASALGTRRESTPSLMAALVDELAKIESRIHDTELAIVDFELSVVGYRISGLLSEARDLRNKMADSTAKLRPLLAPRAGSGHSKEIYDLKAETTALKHAAQVNGKELYKAKLREEELTERRNELMDVKPEPIPEPGHDKFAGLYPI